MNQRLGSPGQRKAHPTKGTSNLTHQKAKCAYAGHDGSTPQFQIWPIDRLVFYARNPRKNDSGVDRMCSSRALGFDLARHSEIAVRAAGPELVRVRTQTRILVVLEALASAPEVGCREFFRFVDRGGAGDRFVATKFVLDDQQGQTQIGVNLQRDRKPVIAYVFLSGHGHRSHIHRSLVGQKQQNDRSKKQLCKTTRPAGAGRANRVSSYRLGRDAVGALPSLWLERLDGESAFFIEPAMNPRTVCRCHCIVVMESTSKCTWGER